MSFNDLADLVNKGKRKQDRVNTAYNLAGGMGILAVSALAIKIMRVRKLKGEAKAMEEKVGKPSEEVEENQMEGEIK